MGERLNADLVLAALNMALEQRTPRVSSTSAIAARYTSCLRERCRQTKMLHSIGTAYYDAMTQELPLWKGNSSSGSTFQSKAGSDGCLHLD